MMNSQTELFLDLRWVLPMQPIRSLVLIKVGKRQSFEPEQSLKIAWSVKTQTQKEWYTQGNGLLAGNFKGTLWKCLPCCAD